jgi:hypothetical protein
MAPINRKDEAARLTDGRLKRRRSPIIDQSSFFRIGAGRLAMKELLDYWPLPLFALLAAAFLRLLRRPASSAPPYEKRGSLLSPVGQQFYHSLAAAVGDRFAICPRLRAADVLQVRSDAAAAGPWQGRIDSGSIDFVLCDPRSLAPRAAIVLEEAAPSPGAGSESESFLDRALAAAGVPLVRVTIAKVYDAKKLSEAIDAALA